MASSSSNNALVYGKSPAEMSIPPYTSSPWRAYPSVLGMRAVIIRKPEAAHNVGRHVGQVWFGDDDGDELTAVDRANATLMAGAPELFEACLALMATIERGPHTTPQVWAQRLSRARDQGHRALVRAGWLPDRPPELAPLAPVRSLKRRHRVKPRVEMRYIPHAELLERVRGPAHLATQWLVAGGWVLDARLDGWVPPGVVWAERERARCKPLALARWPEALRAMCEG